MLGSNSFRSPRFPICKIEMIRIELTSEGCHENE